MVITLPNSYTSEFTGEHNDEYDARITAIEENYLPLAGGTMTGTIHMTDTGYTTPAASGITTDSSGNFHHNRDTSTDTFNLFNNAGSSTFAHEWETGNLKITGTLTANNFIFFQQVTSLDCNNCSQGIYIVRGSITNGPITNHGMFLYITNLGTPFQMYFPDNLNKIYK